MLKRITFVIALLALTASYADASRFSCGGGEEECSHDAHCDGDVFERSGCSITCFNQVEGGQPGEIENGGSATCSELNV